MKKGDFWVEHTQMWLNNTFGNHKEWVRLQEDGVTGSATIAGLIRGFQIHNGLSPITGGIGPATRRKFKELPIISLMDPNGPEDINVFLIQGALFCKGYNAGGLTGIFYNKGVAAIKSLESDASIPENGTIGWKEWYSLLSMNWFKLTSSGLMDVRDIQKYVNKKYAEKINYVGACDGVVSRQTIFSLISALQSVGGIATVEDINEVVFGPKTLEICDKLYKEKNKSYHELIKCGLCINGYKINTDYGSELTTATRKLINDFLRDYGLITLSQFTPNEPTAGVMKSLLTSNGIDRDAKACDCATVLNEQQAKDLKNAGYEYVGRYLTGTVGVGANERSKMLTDQEVKYITNAGMSIFPIYQDGGYYQNYFKKDLQGATDAIKAIKAAEKIGFKEGTVIYFAVDYDCFGNDIKTNIEPYFKKIKLVFDSADNTRKYKIGIYAPREVCTKLSSIAKYSFVCDMSTGFTGNLGKRIPSNWAFDQFKEFKFSSSPTFDLDKNGHSGKDKGCNIFTPVDNQEKLEIAEYVARMTYFYETMDKIGYLQDFIDARLVFEKSHTIAKYIDFNKSIKVNVIPSVRARTGNSEKLIIDIDTKGNLTTAFTNQLSEISKRFEPGDKNNSIEKIISKTALAMKVGDFTGKIELLPPSTLKLIFIASTDSLPIEENNIIAKHVEASLTVEIEITTFTLGETVNTGLLGDLEFKERLLLGTVILGAAYGPIPAGFAKLIEILGGVGIALFT